MRTENLRSVTLDEIVSLPVYPVADIFPMLPKNAGHTEGGGRKAETISLAELSDNINENGLQEPIVLFRKEGSDGNFVTMILDGRNRRAACSLIKNPDRFDPDNVPVEDFVGSDEEADEYILALNIDRRDLTTGQRAMVAVEYWELVPSNQGSRTDLSPNSGRSTTGTAEALAARFRVGKTAIEEARRQKKLVLEAQTRVESARQEIERQATLEREARVAIEAAKVDEDAARIRDAVDAANRAANARADEQTKLAARTEEVAKRQQAINNVKSGQKSLNALKTGSPGQDIAVDDKVSKAKARINKVVTDFLNDFAENAITLVDDIDSKPADREFVRQKLIKLTDFMEVMNKRFSDIDTVDMLIDPEDNRNHWNSIEARNRN